MKMNILDDSFARIKNSYKLNRRSVLIIRSKKVISVLDVLYDEGFIRGYNFVNVDGKKQIKVLLKYSATGVSVIKNIKTISRGSRRVYVKANILWGLYSRIGFGCYILSTSKGVLSLREALEHRIGGELMCYVV